MRELETNRLYLRRVSINDAQEMYKNWANSENVTRFLEWSPHRSVEDTKAFLSYILPQYEQDDCFRWGIVRKSDNVLMGMIDVVRFRNGCPEIGYSSGEMFWGNGYMTEACKAVINELFSFGYNTIFISAVKENIGSNRVIQKSGFKFVESKERSLSDIKPVTVTMNYYRLDKE